LIKNKNSIHKSVKVLVFVCHDRCLLLAVEN